MPETSCACRMVLRIPTWPHEVITTRPRFFTLKQVACSWVCSSGSTLHCNSDRREMRVLRGVAAEAVLDPIFHHGVGQNLLDAGAPDLPGGEGVAGDHSWVLAQHGRDLVSRQGAPIERAKVGQLAGRPDQAMAEVVLAASVELHVRRQ